MGVEYQEAQRGLQRQADAHLEGGRPLEAARVLTQMALIAMGEDDVNLSETTSFLQKAADVARNAGGEREYGAATLSRARILAAAGEAKAALRAYEDAMRSALRLGDKDAELERRHEIMKFHARQDDPSKALAESELLLRVLEELPPSTLQVDVLEERAALWSTRLRFLSASRELDAAIEVAAALGDVPRQISLRVSRHQAETLESSMTPRESLADIEADAVPVGGEPLAELRLALAGEALAAQRYDEAERAAVAAKAWCLESGDFNRYLLASFALADALAGQGDQVEAVGTLIRCRNSLGHAAGPALAAQVDHVLQAVQDKLGADEMQRIVQELVRRGET